MKDSIKCKDCKYLQRWQTPEQAEQYDCSLEVLLCPSPDDYCSKAERKEVSRDKLIIDLANAIESDDSGWWTKKRILSALRNI